MKFGYNIAARSAVLAVSLMTSAYALAKDDWPAPNFLPNDSQSKSVDLAKPGMSTTQAADRLPTIPVEQYSAEQKQAVMQYEAVRKAPIFGPFEVMLYSPAMMSNAREVGDYMKAGSAIPRNLAELAILYIAKDWNQDYVWYQHAPLALKAGLAQSHVDALGYGQKPANMNDDEDAVYAFVNELVRNHQVADQTFDRINRRFGSKGVVDLTSLTAFYVHLSMQLNVAKFKLPPDATGVPRRAEASKP